MANLNKVLLIGRLTADPELRYTPSGTAVADLRMAVNEYSKSASGEKKESTLFISVTLWSKQAEVASQYLKKGRQVFIEGRLKYDSWEGKDGQKRSKISVVGHNMQFIDSKSTSSNSSVPSQDEEEFPF